jgi:hypothetical protein
LWEAFEEDAHPPPSDVQTGQSIRFSKRRWQMEAPEDTGFIPRGATLHPTMLLAMAPMKPIAS